MVQVVVLNGYVVIEWIFAQHLSLSILNHLFFYLLILLCQILNLKISPYIFESLPVPDFHLLFPFFDQLHVSG